MCNILHVDDHKLTEAGTAKFFVKSVRIFNKHIQKYYSKVFGVTPLRCNYARDVFGINEEKLKRGQTFVFTGDNVEGTNEIVSLNTPEIIADIKPGQKILANNGLIGFKVIEVKNFKRLH